MKNMIDTNIDKFIFKCEFVDGKFHIQTNQYRKIVHIIFITTEHSRKASIKYTPLIYRSYDYDKMYKYYDSYIILPMEIPMFSNMIDLLSFVFNNNKYRYITIYGSQGIFGFKYKTDVKFILNDK